MSEFFEIVSSTGSYGVRIETGALDGLLRDGADTVALCDPLFSGLLEKAGIPTLPVEADEGSKSLDAMPRIITALRDARATRGTRLLAVGGGTVQDVAGFTASIYMRGISWLYVPTTLLGMADSCIGGKSSINVGPYKNIVGTFYPPVSIVVDPALIETLPATERIAGLCEAAKICFARGPGSIDAYFAENPSIDMSTGGFARIVALSLRAKKWFIEIDEFDRAERLLLNFGHTFGHALEGASHFRIGHGVAVGLGMLCALRLGRLQGRDYDGLSRLSALERHVDMLLRQVPDLRDGLARVEMDDVVDRFQADKKHTADRFMVIMVNDGGALERVALPKTENSIDLLRRAFLQIIEAYGR